MNNLKGKPRETATHVATAVTVIIFILTGWVETQWLWGINHLYYLGPGTRLALASAAALIVFLPLFPIRLRLHRILEALDRFVFGKKIMPRVTTAALGVCLFYFLRLETYFLGDGYTFLNVFGDGEAYVHRWVEYGSIHLVRTLQAVSGGYTKETAKSVFQILSVFSGGIALYCIFGIVRYLCRTVSERIIGLAMLLFSGSILLFFGYIEFYPLLWGSVLAFIYLTLRAVMDSRSLFPAILAYLAAIAVHALAIIMLPSLLLILIKRIRNERWRRSISGLAILGGVASAAVFLWLLQTRVEFAAMFLPPFTGRMPTPEYAILSPAHLLDILNLLLLICPGILLALTLIDRRKPINNSVLQFLFAASLSSFLFLLLFNPLLGLARDWDLLSICLLCPMLLLISFISQPQSVTPKGVFRIVGISAVMTVSFLMVNINIEASEDRFRSLLEHGGLTDRAGWEILRAYRAQNGDQSQLGEVSAKRDSIFTDYVEMDRLKQMLGSGVIPNPDEVNQLIDRNPFDPNFLQFAGSIYTRLGQLPKAEGYYDLAHRLKPDNRFIQVEYAQLMMRQKKYRYALKLFGKALALAPGNLVILESMGLAYYRMGQYGSVVEIADSLFIGDRNSAGAHSLLMIVAIAQSEHSKARIHYLEYLRYGNNRSDYQRIKQSYQFLLSR